MSAPRYHPSRRQHNAGVYGYWFGVFMLIGAALWLLVVTYGLVLVPVIGDLALYRRKTGRWPGRHR